MSRAEQKFGFARIRRNGLVEPTVSQNEAVRRFSFDEADDEHDQRDDEQQPQ